MPSWGPDLVNKLILFYSILHKLFVDIREFDTSKINVYLSWLPTVSCYYSTVYYYLTIFSVRLTDLYKKGNLNSSIQDTGTSHSDFYRTIFLAGFRHRLF